MLLWAAFGFAISTLTGTLLLAAHERLNLRQRAYELAPQSHQAKSGTPTMGGLVFLAAFLGMLLVSNSSLTRDLVFLVGACAAIGVLDDYLAISGVGKRGLRSQTKLLLTILVAATFMRALGASPNGFARDVILLAGSFALAVPHWLWFVLGVLAITATIHAVNLTDGLDGLATGAIIPPLIVLGVLSARSAVPAAAEGAFVGVGACAGFLIFNRHPAKLFMGDTGSLALGALLSGVAVLSGEMLLLVVVGGVFVAETLSVIVQVGYFKATRGKRILRMSPLHHHFELAGWPETKVTTRFWLASLICSLLGWTIVR